MNNSYKKLNEMKAAGIWFNRVPQRPGVYTWEAIFEGRAIETGAVFWHCVRNTWRYLERLKNGTEDRKTEV